MDGAPVDPALLDALTDALAIRGQDARETWIGANVGLGHALLKTTPEQQHERQPSTFDGEVWVTADVRLDGRSDLLAELALHGRSGLEARPDSDLLLHAY